MRRAPRIVLVLAVIAAGATAASSGLARSAAVHLWPVEPFSRCTSDPRIFCEPGSEPFARAIAALLPTAIARVEQQQYGPFRKPVKITTYASQDTYALYAGHRAGAATTSFGEVHLAPRMRGLPGQHAALLGHELSHLHLLQRAGALATMRMPNWFTEGWATSTSGGGGAGGVDPEQAVFALVHGVHFTPGETESLFSPTRAHSFKLGGAMYYRQASLFVGYLQRRDANAFAGMVRELEAGEPFASALRRAYGQPLPGLWQDFRAGLRYHPAAQARG